jgi:hypothetical protein
LRPTYINSNDRGVSYNSTGAQLIPTTQVEQNPSDSILSIHPASSFWHQTSFCDIAWNTMRICVLEKRHLHLTRNKVTQSYPNCSYSVSAGNWF